MSLRRVNAWANALTAIACPLVELALLYFAVRGSRAALGFLVAWSTWGLGLAALAFWRKKLWRPPCEYTCPCGCGGQCSFYAGHDGDCGR